MGIFAWIKSHKLVSILSIVIVSVVTSFLQFLRIYNDAKDAKAMIDLILENFEQIVEFSFSPYFA
jgi:hypothetical protein